MYHQKCLIKTTSSYYKKITNSPTDLDLSVFLRVQNRVIDSLKKDNFLSYSIKHHAIKYEHGLTGKPSNLSFKYAPIQKLFKVFIVKNRTPTGRQKGVKYYLDPIFCRLKNRKTTPKDERSRALLHCVQCVIAKLHQCGKI